MHSTFSPARSLLVVAVLVLNVGGCRMVLSLVVRHVPMRLNVLEWDGYRAVSVFRSAGES